jgi:hypothetical protein
MGRHITCDSSSCNAGVGRYRRRNVEQRGIWQWRTLYRELPVVWAHVEAVVR